MYIKNKWINKFKQQWNNKLSNNYNNNKLIYHKNLSIILLNLKKKKVIGLILINYMINCSIKNIHNIIVLLDV